MEQPSGKTSEELDEVEAKLAERLKSRCSPWGTETESHMLESASIFLDLGVLHLQKVKASSGMTQKLGFIKCAALISGARVRYEQLFQSDKEKEARKAYMEMAKTLLLVCNARDTESNLLKISDEISSKLGRLRENEKAFIKTQLAPLCDEIPESDLRDRKKHKVGKVKTLLKRNTSEYLSLMKSLSEECIKTLGEPPCKFAVVGLGSLAREEITLYSDFEHVILLERGIDESPACRIREYFRWYSVIFQVIIIGIGETYIPTVDIKSLNDLYSEDKSKKWYFDLYTPGGVSFDGRLPHACKTPLGMQSPSKVVELIQPVEKMLEYIYATQEDLKNLREVLLRTCFVHGYEEIYDDFRQGTVAFMQKETQVHDVEQQLEFYRKSVTGFMSGSIEAMPRVYETMDFEKIKDFLYRPATVMIGCLRRIYRCFLRSNFDFFPWFRESQPTVYLDDLEYALVVACEVRLKLYSKVGHLRQKAWPGDTCKFVSKSCLVRSIRTLLSMGLIFKAVAEYSKFDKFSKCLSQTTQLPMTISEEADFLEMLGFSDDAIEQRQRDGKESASSYLAAGLNDASKIDDHFHKAEDLLNVSGEPAVLTFEYAKTMSLIHFRRGRHQDGFYLAERWTKNYRENKLGPLNDFRYMQVQHIKAYCLSSGMQAKEVEKYAGEEIARSCDAMTQIFFRIVLCDARLLMDDTSGAKLALQSATLACMHPDTAIHLPPDVHLQAAKVIFKKQMTRGWTDDANLTFSAIGMLQPTVNKNTTEKHTVRYENLIPKSHSVKGAELVRKWVEVERNEKQPAHSSLFYRNAILMLLLKRGIENFSDVAKQFREAPRDVLHDNVFYSALNSHISKYCMHIADKSFYQVGQDLMAVFREFPCQFKNPIFLGTFRPLVTAIVMKSVELKRDIENISAAMLRRYRDQDEETRLFKLGVRKFVHLNLNASVDLLWRVLNRSKKMSVQAKDSSNLLAYMISIAPFVAVLHFLSEHRSTFANCHSFLPTYKLTVEYNDALTDYVKFRFRSSATSFWRIILESHSFSSLRKKSIEMLMFVILTQWERDGFIMDIGKKYIYNKASTVRHNAVLYHDLYFALLLGSEDTRIAMENAFASQI